MSTNNPRRHPEDGDDGPIELVLVCEECGAEEPAPVDVAVGQVVDCANCGEASVCEER